MILGKLLYKLGLPFCEHCGKHKSFDDEKFNLGYKVKSMCPDCDRPSGGYKRAKIFVGESKEFKPLLGIACFETRHGECKEDKDHCRCWCHSSYDGFWYKFFCQGCGNEVSTTDKKNFAEKLCVDCDRPTGMMRGYLFWDKPMRNEDEYIPRSVDTMTEGERKLYLESMGF